MKSLTEYLSEGFPPAQKKSGPPKPPAPGGKSTFPSKKAEAGGGPPSNFPPQKDAGTPNDDDAMSLEDESVDPNDPNAQGDATEVYMLQQQMAAEKEQAELEARRQKAEEEAAERQRIKKMRLAADDEVADALADKYNDDHDTVTFFPDIITFAQYDKDGNVVDGKKVDEDGDEEEGKGKKALSDEDDDDGAAGNDDESSDDVEDAEEDDASDDEDDDIGELEDEDDDDADSDNKNLKKKEKKPLKEATSRKRFYVWSYEYDEEVSSFDDVDDAIAAADEYKSNHPRKMVYVKDRDSYPRHETVYET